MILDDSDSNLRLDQPVSSSPVSASNDEVLELLEQNRLFGKGLGWVDVHLLASTLLSGCRLWTLDSPLRDAAVALGIGYSAIM